MKLLILSVLLFSVIATFSSAVTLKEFLFEGDAPSDLSKSTDLARKEQERILNLIELVRYIKRSYYLLLFVTYVLLFTII